MRTKLLIIEDNHYKYFATKQVLVSQLHLDVSVCEIANQQELLTKAQTLNPDWVIFRPHGGMHVLLEKMKQRRVNRRNTEVIIALAPELDLRALRSLQELATKSSRGCAEAA